MEKPIHQCFNCGNYGAYYTKGYCHFDRTKCGSCSKSMKIVNNTDSCVFWRSRPVYRIRTDTMARKVLVDILMSLSEIKQILQEEQEEENECTIKQMP